MNETLVSIIFYNEIKNIKKTLEQTKKISYNYLMVDDGSNDGSSEIAKKEKYVTIKHKKNYGYGKSVKTSLKYAKKKGYKYLVIFPGDNQRRIEDINKMYQAINSNENLTYVVGSKFHLLKGIPFRRKIGNLFFSKISKLWGNNNKDVLSGFKIYNIKKSKKIIMVCPNDYTFDLIFNYLSSKKNESSEIDAFCNYINQTSKIKSLSITFYQMIKQLIKFSILKKL
jgi:glycosyltransferase involved in cell wall biosynthesis